MARFEHCSWGSCLGPSRTEQSTHLSSMTKYRQYEEFPGFPKTALLSFVRTSGNSVPCRGREGGQIYNAGGKEENYPLTKITMKPTEKKPVTVTSRTGNTANCMNTGRSAKKTPIRKVPSPSCTQSLSLRRSGAGACRAAAPCPRLPGPQGPGAGRRGGRGGVAPHPLPSQAGLRPVSLGQRGLLGKAR